MQWLRRSFRILVKIGLGALVGIACLLVGLLLDATGDVRRDDKIRTVEGKEIGWITSATRSPHLNRTVALGYVKYDYLQPGTPVRIINDDAEREAHVAELPFVRGSWYEKDAKQEI